jgi:hypothetical protein
MLFIYLTVFIVLNQIVPKIQKGQREFDEEAEGVTAQKAEVRRDKSIK